MKKFFEEFKKFIMRGNVVDMAVGVVVGSSFTAIVNGMTNYILKPIVNWLLALIFSVKMNVSAFALRALGVLICSVLGANVGVGSRTEGKRKKKNAHRTRG